MFYNQRKYVKKIKKTCVEKYGVDNPAKSPEIIFKSKQTCVEKYGVDAPSKSPIILNKNKETNKQRYGVEWPTQDSVIFIKGQKTRCLIHRYKNTKIYYRGSYEFHFLCTYYLMFKGNLKNGPRIKYFFDNRFHYYHSDFFIPSLNLVIEIKNNYLAQRDKEIIEAKEKATIANGFKYIMIVEKDYTEFNRLYLPVTSPYTK